jgi:hypothetical protein
MGWAGLASLLRRSFCASIPFAGNGNPCHELRQLQMNHDVPSIPARIAIRTISLAVAFHGIDLLIGAATGFSHRDQSLAGPILEIGVGFLCVTLASLAIFKPGATAVRWLCLVAAFLVYLFACRQIDTLFRHITGLSVFAPPPDMKAGHYILIANAFLLTLFLIVALFYRLLVGWLLGQLKLTDHRTPMRQRWATRWSVGVMTFIIIAFGSELAFVAVGAGGTPTAAQENIWESVTPVFLALIASTLFEIFLWRARRVLGLKRDKSEANTTRS